jgi:hypothetical protein
MLRIFKMIFFFSIYLIIIIIILKKKNFFFNLIEKYKFFYFGTFSRATISDGFCKYTKSYFGGDAFELMNTLKIEDLPIIKVISATVKEKDDSASVVILKF